MKKNKLSASNSRGRRKLLGFMDRYNAGQKYKIKWIGLKCM